MCARILFLLSLSGLFAAVEAQTSAPAGLGLLQQNAEKKTTAWLNLHATFEDNLSRLLPCDARAVKTIEDVNRSSDARIEAWITYTAQWRSLAATESRNAKRTEAELNAQSGVLQAEKLQLENQIADLRTRRAALPATSEALKPLDQLIDLNSQRIAAISDRTAALDAAKQSVATLVSAAESRAAAVDKEAAQWTDQAARWRAYYAARISRAKTECAITGQSTAPRAPRKKQ